MSKIPTAEELIEKHYGDCIFGVQISAEEIIEWMKEFAQLHVEAALKNADSLCKVNIIHWTDWEKKSDIILNAYPKELIK